MSTYLYQQPLNVTFAIPFSDNSGDALRVYYNSETFDIQIIAADAILLVAKENLEWLINSLRDAQSLYKETIKPDNK